MRPIVCMITPAATPRDLPVLAARIADAAHAGLHLVQIRQPALDGRALADLVRLARDAVRGTSTRVLVNDRLDVALVAGGHGLHLREDSIPSSRVRPIVPRGFLIGRSVHGVDGVRRASAQPLDYLLFGTVFASTSKPGVPPAGLPALSEAVRSTPLPVLAIGGVTRERIDEVARTGAAGIAAIGLFSDDAARAVADVARLWPRR